MAHTNSSMRLVSGSKNTMSISRIHESAIWMYDTATLTSSRHTILAPVRSCRILLRRHQRLSTSKNLLNGPIYWISLAAKKISLKQQCRIWSGHLYISMLVARVIRTVKVNTIGRHQKQALTFMLRRERGWKPDDAWPDIWETQDTSYARRWVRSFSRSNCR
jgi:hypothetical protein